jgi:hypothetical protein
MNKYAGSRPISKVEITNDILVTGIINRNGKCKSGKKKTSKYSNIHLFHLCYTLFPLVASICNPGSGYYDVVINSIRL